MGRFTKIKRKKPKFRRQDFMADWWEAEDRWDLIHAYMKERPGPEISVDEAYDEMERKGLLDPL